MEELYTTCMESLSVKCGESHGSLIVTCYIYNRVYVDDANHLSVAKKKKKKKYV